jgi:exodeoxyribonuclease V beta subunit
MSDTYYSKPAQLPSGEHRLVVVEASAGTGKTYFLEHRVVDLIIEQGATLPQILLVTFTEKATAELRRRIRNIVDTVERSTQSSPPASGPAWHITPAVRKQLATARADFGQASIFTIHGFCQRMLVEDAFTAGRLFEQERIADETAFEAAYYALLREELAREPQSRVMLQQYLANGGSVEELFKVMLGCARKSHCEMRPPPTKAYLLAAAQAVVDARGNDEWAAVANRIKNKTSVKAAVSRLDAIAERVLPVLARGGDGVEEYEVFAALGAVIEDAAWFRHPKTAQATQSAIAGIPALADALVVLSTAVTLEAYLVAQWLPRALDRMAASKAQLAQFDYQDLLKHLWEALSGPRGDALAAVIRGKLPWALIDEFQDTDDLQWNIFRRIWMHPDARGLTIVGDPKQSIYSFRGADVAVYLAARRELEAGGAASVVLSENHRSTAQLVDGVNLLLGAGTLTPLFNGSVAYDTPSRAAGKIVAANEPAVRVWLPPVRGKPSATRERTVFADAIAAEIERLLAAPIAWAEHDKIKRLQPSDIMVLTRSSYEGDTMARLLAARGIATSRVQQERLFATREAAELRDVFEAIARPRDRAARLRALRSRFFSVPWNQLAELASVPDHHPLFALLTHWQHLADARRFDTLFHSLVEDSGLAARTIALCGAERALVNTQHVLDLLAERTAARPMEFHEVSELLRSWISSGDQSRDDELDVQRVETDGDAVQIMTVHRAKGLEAAVVFLYGGDIPPPARSKVFTYHHDGRRQLAVGKRQPEAVQRLIDDDIDQENRRLAYVAMTRAKVRLYVSSYGTLPDLAAYHCLTAMLHGYAANAAKPPVQGLLQFVQLTAQPTALADADAGSDDASDEGDATDDGAMSDATLRVLAAVAVPPPPDVVSLTLNPSMVLPRSQTHGALLSYSKLARQAAAAAAAEAVDAAVLDSAMLSQKEIADESAEPVALNPDELPPGAASGLLVHDVLEQTILALQAGALAPALLAPESDPALFAALPLVAEPAQRAAHARGISAPAHIQHALTIAHRTLSTPLASVADASLPALSQAADLAAEVEFWFPAGAHRFVRGAIDAVASWDGTTLWIVDYKSDLLGDSAVAPDETATARLAAAHAKVADKYALQAAVYTAALTRMLAPGQTVGGVLFCFVRYGIVVESVVSSAALAAAQQRWEAVS